jgi:hypothetical protein
MSIRKFIFLLFTCISTFSFSQEKLASKKEMETKLVACENSISSVDEKISILKNRVALQPETSSNRAENQMYTNQRIEQLEQEKALLIDVRNSLLHFLNLSDSKYEARVITISKEEFAKYPKEKQEQILAFPARYSVLKN